MEIKKIVGVIIIIFAIAIVITITLLFLTSMKDNFFDVDTNSTSEYILADNDSAQTLGEIPLTFSATAKNQTWLSFDGVNDNIYDSSWAPTIYYDTDFSFSVFFNTSSSTSTKDIILRVGIDMLYLNKGILEFYVRNSSNDNVGVNSSYVNDSLWHNVVVKTNTTNKNLSIYIDGVLINSTGLGSLSTSGGVFKIGYTINSWEGYLDEFRYYNKSLSDTEISEIYASGRSPNSSLNSTGLVLWLPLNENTGTDVHSLNQSDFK